MRVIAAVLFAVLILGVPGWLVAGMAHLSQAGRKL
jgi:hypothetical protein